MNPPEDNKLVAFKKPRIPALATSTALTKELRLLEATFTAKYAKAKFSPVGGCTRTGIPFRTKNPTIDPTVTPVTISSPHSPPSAIKPASNSRIPIYSHQPSTSAFDSSTPIIEFVDAQTGAYTNPIETTWGTVKKFACN